METNRGEQDFPAAHSMDSSWWAVDGQGHVAVFHTGEAGAMPAECAIENEFNLLEVLFRANIAGLTFYCDDLLAEADHGFYRVDWETPWNEVANKKLPADLDGYSSGILIWLKDEQGLAALSPATPSSSLLGRITQVFSPPAPAPSVRRLPCPGKVVVWLALDESATDKSLGKHVSQLLASGTALRAWQYISELEHERFGFYSYSHDACDNWIAGPLERTAPPPQAITVDRLPGEIGQAVARCKLTQADFSRDVLVQPFEEVASYCWSDTWVSTDGHELRRDDPDQGRSQLAASPANIPPAEVRSTLTVLLDAWLRGEEGGHGVLNDFLQESNLPVPRDAPGPAQRLDEIMQTFFTPEELLLVEADIVEHVRTDDGAVAIDAVLQGVRGFAAGSVAVNDLRPLAYDVLQAWRDFDEEEGPAPQVNRAAWAAFALAQRWPLAAARTARSLAPGELTWQVDYVLRRLEEGRRKDAYRLNPKLP